MSKTLFAITLVLSLMAAALLNADDPVAAVKKYIDAFNKGDLKGMSAVCDSPAVIIDGLPPHSWQGPTACEDWYRDVIAAGAKEGAGDYFVTLGEPRHVDVRGDRAYVVVPATMKFKVHGKEITQNGSTMTLALHKVGDQWRIAGWAWAKGGR
jgi:ketosteroid isomerase-like protein